MEKRLRLSIKNLFDENVTVKRLRVGEILRIPTTIYVKNVTFCHLLLNFDKKFLNLLNGDIKTELEGGTYRRNIIFELMTLESTSKNNIWVLLEARADDLVQTAGFFVEII